MSYEGAAKTRSTPRASASFSLDRRNTPTTWQVARAGLVSGPSRLKLCAEAARGGTGCTCFVDECMAGAKRKAIPICSRQAADLPVVQFPRSRHSFHHVGGAALRGDRAPRLPCFATRTRATKAVAVEMLKVPLASPPVPQVSTRASRPASRTALVRSSSGVPEAALGESYNFFDGLALHVQRYEQRQSGVGAWPVSTSAAAQASSRASDWW